MPTTQQPRYIDAAETAKMIRPVLRETFPGIAFSVRISRFSMGSAVDVHWTDGPTERQVDAILSAYAGERDINGEAVRFPSSMYVTGSRTLSDDFRALLRDDLEVASGEHVDHRGMVRAYVGPGGHITAAVAVDYVADLVHRLSQFVSVTAEREVQRVA